MEESGSIFKVDPIKAACVGPRCRKILEYIIDNNQDIELRKSGSITLHFSDRTLKIEEKIYKEL
jgi:hypothetical protein